MTVPRTDVPAVQDLHMAGMALVLRAIQPDDPSDRDALLELHNAVFGSSVGVDWFDWKYRDGCSVGIGLWQGRSLIAHCGGVPRSFWQADQMSRFLQIGDVMVVPNWRGVFRRDNPFSAVSRALYGQFLGADKPFKVGFGFPNDRHMRLAVKTGLAWHVADMHQLCWDTPSHHTGMTWTWRVVELPQSWNELTQVAHSWRNMQTSLVPARLRAGVRDHAHVLWRYLKRPDQAYRFAAIKRPWRRSWLGIVVMSEQNPGQWLDWIGPIEAMPLACLGAQSMARKYGAPQLTAWCSPPVEAYLQHTMVVSRSLAARVCVPINSDLKPDLDGEFSWWLMGGDTDFL